MDTLGPRVMVNVGTQAASNTGVNPRDLAPLTNDAFLATFLGKTSLSASNGISRQHNNYRQSYTTQMERVTLRSKPRPTTSNGESGEADSAILSIIRSNGSDNQQQQQQSSFSSQRQLQGTRNRRRSFNQQQLLNDWNDVPCSPNYRPSNDFNRRRRTRSGGAQQQITVVDQMAAQPHIPYAILPKRFEPKQANGLQQQQQQQSRSYNNNNNFNGDNRRSRRPNPSRYLPSRQPYYDDNQWVDEQNDDLWFEPLQPSMRRRMNPRVNRNWNQSNGYYDQRQPFDNYYDSYAYGPSNRQGQVPFRPRRRMLYADDAYLSFDIIPAYDLNEWQGPYARSRQAQQRGGARYGRNENAFIRDDHRVNASTKQSRNGYKPSTPTRNGKQSKSPRNKGQQKRRNSQGRKQRNQNSKSEATSSANNNEVKLTNENETKQETTTTNESEQQQQPLPPRDQEQNNNNEQN